MAAKEFIVAIELGSLKITGIAGRKGIDGSLQVLAVVREDATPCIRKGVVYNIDKTSACLTHIIKKLKRLLKSEISQVFVGMGGQSIRGILNSSVMKLPEDTIITQEMINELMDENRSTQYPDLEILDAATQEFKVGTLYQKDPVGIQCDKIEGHFLNIVCRKAFYRNLNKSFEKANISIADMYIAPIALAQSILTETEMRGGCLLVDLGAATTTVSVYHKDILRHLAVIPLGGDNITKDITTLNMEENEAEALKIKYATALSENDETDPEETLPIDAEHTVSAQAFHDLVEARVNEIIQNIWFGQVLPDYHDKLLGGIILTGGGSKMKNIKRAFAAITGIQKIRIAETVNRKVTSNDKDIDTHDCMMNTALALLAKGDANCAGQVITPKTDLFDTHPITNSAPSHIPNAQSGESSKETPVETPRPEGNHPSKKRTTPDQSSGSPKGNWFSRGLSYLQDLALNIVSAEDEEHDNH